MCTYEIAVYFLQVLEAQDRLATFEMAFGIESFRFVCICGHVNLELLLAKGAVHLKSCARSLRLLGQWYITEKKSEKVEFLPQKFCSSTCMKT